MPVDHIESGDQPLAAFLVQILDRLAQPADRFGQIFALGREIRSARLDLVKFFIGAQIDGAETFAILP